MSAYSQSSFLQQKIERHEDSNSQYQHLRAKKISAGLVCTVDGYTKTKTHDFSILQINQARSQEFALGGEGFGGWKQQQTIDFDWSSFRLSRFLCPNSGDLQKKKSKIQGLH